MLSAYLNDPPSWEPLLAHPVWRESMEWLKAHAAISLPGDYPLGKAGWYANVHGYTTLREQQCIWESHAETIDVQYVIDGEEGIRWAPSFILGEPKKQLKDRDRLEWHPPKKMMPLLSLCTGMFAIFLPGEAHCPMIAIEQPMPIRKAVVKIPLHLLKGLSA